MNRTLEAMAQALFRSWFVDFDPVRAKAEGRQPEGMDAETAALFPSRLVHSELGEIPEGWIVRPVGDVVSVCGGSTPSTSEPSYWEGGSINWTTPKDLSRLEASILLKSERQITERGLATISSGLLPSGTVLLSSRAPIGYVALTEIPTAVNQGFIAMRCEGVLPNYYMLNWTLRNVERIKERANGSTFMEISKSNFRPLPVVVPQAEVLRGFVQVVGPLYRRVTTNLRESQALADLRDLLLPKLLSGEVRVRDAEAHLAASA
jgi:type I restriction enzyme S subunit